jgi:phage-related protein
MEIRFFDKSLKKFIFSLEDDTASKVFREIDLLREFGNKLTFPHSKMVESKLFELRIRGKQEVRIFYIFREDFAMLLNGFIKKSEKTPERELATARARARSLQ